MLTPASQAKNLEMGLFVQGRFQYQTGFRLDPFPKFTYEIQGVRVEKSVFMLQWENTTVVQYDIFKTQSQADSSSLSLEIRPLIAFRDYHSTTHENGALNPNVELRTD